MNKGEKNNKGVKKNFKKTQSVIGREQSLQRNLRTGNHKVAPGNHICKRSGARPEMCAGSRHMPKNTKRRNQSSENFEHAKGFEEDMRQNLDGSGKS